ncbi:phosphotransferase family protein [Amycolatopsis sp.]|uniref:phosphotransferase family protein n=1 Tax=Amycolatopsis sp. TaxID=37632 RepID=UPI002BFCA3EF|nr:phosphotransferase family protein [Amycolatopsis sp.]HVV08088.1 phosphotransferase family protein [Amycolatopsis sp.]
MSTENTTTSTGLDEQRLARWLDAQGLPGGGGDLVVTALQGGSQNQLYELRAGETRLVLRAAPGHASPERAERMLREYQLVRALAGTDVPHARVHAASTETDIAGQPFYVMDHVEGWSPMQGGWAAPFDTDTNARAGLATQLVDGIARLSKVDWRAAGLEGFGRPEGFHDRQVDRWLSFLDKYAFRELPGLQVTADWLRAHRPRAYTPGILHGDYQFANVMYAHGAPARLAAIVDWEMATIGDPLLDLGWALIAWGPEGDDMTHARYLDYTGMPSRDDLLEHYATVSGRGVEDIDYYVILARFKLGIVLEQSVARAAATGGDPKVARFDGIVLELIRKAAELTRSTTLK